MLTAADHQDQFPGKWIHSLSEKDFVILRSVQCALEIFGDGERTVQNIKECGLEGAMSNADIEDSAVPVNNQIVFGSRGNQDHVSFRKSYGMFAGTVRSISVKNAFDFKIVMTVFNHDKISDGAGTIISFPSSKNRDSRWKKDSLCFVFSLEGGEKRENSFSTDS